MPAAAHRLQQHAMPLEAGTFYYQVTGAGPPLVLLHGLSGSSRWWRRNIASLARHSRVHLVDLLGFGRSRGQRFSLRQAATVLAGWMDRLGLERADLAGHSMGGFIAADLAARYPRRVDRLVLVDAAAIPFSRGYARDAWGLVRALRYLPPNFLPLLLADALGAGALTIARAIREILRTDMTSRLASIQAPTLIVWGQFDTLLPVEIGLRLCQHLPHAQWALIEGAGHNPMYDRPEAFNRVVAEFLCATPRQAPVARQNSGAGQSADAPSPAIARVTRSPEDRS